MAEKKEYKNALKPGYELVGGDHAYTIEQVLGQGGFGITYRVTAKIKAGNITIKTKFAVKEFFPSECWREPGSPKMRYSPNQTDEIREGLADFVNEGKRLQMVCQKNSNIVNVNEVFQDKATGTAYFVMEYLEGGDLCSIVRASGGGLSETALMSFLNPIAHAVQSLHENKMLHLDIKPENIVMRRSDAPSEADTPVLIDFGIAVHFKKDGSPTTKNPNKGTSQGYSPTEQYFGVSRFAPQYDIYALAATCFYMLTSRDPKSANEISASDIRNELNGKASDRTIDAIVSGMSRDASDRPKSLEQFLKGFKESNALRIGHIVQGTYQNYLIVAVMEETEDHILYKATTVSNQGDSRSTHATRKTSYYLWEQFSPALGDSRKKDGQVVVTTFRMRPEWLIPSQKGDFEYSKYGTKNNKRGALDCEYFVNGAQYLAVRENYKPTPQWRKNLTQVLDKIHPMQVWEKNKKKILIGAASVLAIFVGFAGVKYWQNNKPDNNDESDATTETKSVDVPADTLNKEDSGHTYVDLGLPSGTKWAECNVGASSKTDYGDYFAWGETSIKSNYDWSTYKYGKKSNNLTKYCTKSDLGLNGFTDNKTELDLEDDVAHQQWGGSWRMPLKEDFEELLKYTTNEWTTINGVNGCLFKATNGNSIFLPAAGYPYGTSLSAAGSGGYYWSRTLDVDRPDYAYYLRFDSYDVDFYNSSRGDGQSVRPVRP